MLQIRSIDIVVGVAGKEISKEEGNCLPYTFFCRLLWGRFEQLNMNTQAQSVRLCA
jgi:hypothetical protein